MAQIYTNKKAQLGAHFHWIFILIAGAIILTFFVSIVIKQKDISEQNIAGKAIGGLDQIFTAAGVTEDTLNKIDIPKIEMEFICSDDYSEYSIRKTGINRNLQTEIVFSPDLVKGDSILIWTLPWSMPFKVDNFMMITSPEIRYIILYDNNEYKAISIFDDLPGDINKEIYSILNTNLNFLKPKDNYKIKLIFVTENEILNQKLPDWMDKEDVSAVRIADGYVQFYNKKPDLTLNSSYQNDYFYLINENDKALLFSEDEKNPMVYAAIFAENSEMYRCSTRKAYKRLELISNIYAERINYLEDFYQILATQTDFPPCTADFYESSFYNSLESNARQCSINPAEVCFEQITRQAFAVKDNNILLSQKGCPLIY